MMERIWKPNVEITPNCPRCGSPNTKFCYYNNYSLTQPRYFCKGCRRYWTKGGSLRNVPIGGGCRKNRRSGKSVRFSTDHHGVSSKSNLACGGGSSINGHSNYCNKVVGSTSSPGGHNIDLALVYANFLNQQPADTKTGSATALEIPEFPGDHQFDPLVEFSNMSGLNLVEENGVVGGMSMGADLSMEAQLSDSLTSGQQNYYSHVFDSVHKQQGGAPLERLCTSRNYNHELPPLPNDEEIMWLNNSDHHMTLNHTLQDQPMLGPDHQLLQDPNLLFGNWTTPFDFSTDDTFTKIT